MWSCNQNKKRLEWETVSSSRWVSKEILSECVHLDMNEWLLNKEFRFHVVSFHCWLGCCWVWEMKIYLRFMICILTYLIRHLTTCFLLLLISHSLPPTTNKTTKNMRLTMIMKSSLSRGHSHFSSTFLLSLYSLWSQSYAYCWEVSQVEGLKC